MNNFIFENTTKVYFGQGGVKEYLESLLANYGSNVLLAYGGGSIKRNGVYAEVTDPAPRGQKCRRVLRHHVQPHLRQSAGGREAGKRKPC